MRMQGERDRCLTINGYSSVLFVFSWNPWLGVKWSEYWLKLPLGSHLKFQITLIKRIYASLSTYENMAYFVVNIKQKCIWSLQKGKKHWWHAVLICYWSFSLRYKSFSHFIFIEENSLLKFKCLHFCVFNKTNIINSYMCNSKNKCVL